MRLAPVVVLAVFLNLSYGQKQKPEFKIQVNLIPGRDYRIIARRSYVP